MTPSQTPASLSSDPLLYLGVDLFVEILSFLPARDILVAERVSRIWNDCAQAYSSGLWRGICLRDDDIEPCNIEACDELARTGCWNVDAHDHRPIADDVSTLLSPPNVRHWASGALTPVAAESRALTPLMTPTLETARVNWRYVCKAHKNLDNAWRTARCRLRWITPPSNTVWRIKSVVEQDVICSTSRTGGLIIVDRQTSEPLFEIEDVAGYTHIEAGRGFVVFNTPGIVNPVVGVQFDPFNPNTAFEVWRTAEARNRSNLSPDGESLVGGSAVSYTHPDEFEPGAKNGFLPRGHIEHFRTLQPATATRASRMHIDGADTDNPRAVFSAAGSRTIFIWHLEESRPTDRIERGPCDRGLPNYIELDDNFVFVCLEEQVQVYSRKTFKHIAGFPGLNTAPQDTAAMAFPLSLGDDFKSIPDAERVRANPNPNDDGVPAPVGRAIVTGAYRGAPEFDEAINRGLAMHSTRVQIDSTEEVEYSFTAVHFTPTDLVCTARTGAVFIVRHYTDVLHHAAELPEDERATYIAKHTFVIGLGTTIRQLTTHRHHIVICTSFNVVVIDGKHLPEIEDDEVTRDPHPTLRAHNLLGNHPQAMKMSSCIQADARSIYLTYWATGEMDASGGHNQGSVSFPPNAALEGFGMCIKVWTFGDE